MPRLHESWGTHRLQRCCTGDAGGIAMLALGEAEERLALPTPRRSRARIEPQRVYRAVGGSLSAIDNRIIRASITRSFREGVSARYAIASDVINVSYTTGVAIFARGPRHRLLTAARHATRARGGQQPGHRAAAMAEPIRKALCFSAVPRDHRSRLPARYLRERHHLFQAWRPDQALHAHGRRAFTNTAAPSVAAAAKWLKRNRRRYPVHMARESRRPQLERLIT